MTIDRSSWWWQRGRAVLAVFAGLLLTGWVTGPLQERAWGVVRERQPELNLRDLQGAVGQGMVLGLLGGFRSIMADFMWIKGYDSWEKRNRPEAESTVYLTTLLDPRAVYFWSNGARIIGKDIPVWRIQQAGRQTTPAEQMAIRHEQALRALSFLDRGLEFHPDNWTLLQDKALLYQNNMGDPYDSADHQYNRQDLTAAAEQYRLAAAAPGAPYYVARVYAELLRRLGRNQEAYDYLRRLYPTLPANVPAATKDIVWERLRELENTLKLPASECLPESAATLPEKPSAPAAPAKPAH
jgi:hypothetical protein